MKTISIDHGDQSRRVIEIGPIERPQPSSWDPDVPECPRESDVAACSCRDVLIDLDEEQRKSRFPLRICLHALTYLIQCRMLVDVQPVIDAMWQRKTPPLTLRVKYEDETSIRIDYDYEGYRGRWMVIREDRNGFATEKEEIVVPRDDDFLDCAGCYLRHRFPEVCLEL